MVDGQDEQGLRKDEAPRVIRAWLPRTTDGTLAAVAFSSSFAVAFMGVAGMPVTTASACGTSRQQQQQQQQKKKKKRE